MFVDVVDHSQMARESLRIGQVDANILDHEYRQLMAEQFERLITELPISLSRLCELIKPEVRVVLDAVMWTTRIFKGASPGQMEMNVSYKAYTQKKIHLHFLISVFIPYLIKRIWTSNSNPFSMRAFSKIAAVFEAACILHYLNFLRVGGQSTLVEAFLSLRNWDNTSPTIGTVNYESQNRELLWHTFRDVLLLVWPAYTALSTKLTSRKGPVLEEGNAVALRCGHCGGVAVAPMRATNCGHTACYWCVTSRAPTDLTRCVICGGEEERIMPVRGTLLLRRKAEYVQDYR